MSCAYHPKKKDVAICIRCEKFIWEQCLVIQGGKSYCRPCYDEVYLRQGKPTVIPVRQQVIEAPSRRLSGIGVTALIVGIAVIVVLVVLSLLKVTVVPIIIAAAIIAGVAGVFWPKKSRTRWGRRKEDEYITWDGGDDGGNGGDGGDGGDGGE